MGTTYRKTELGQQEIATRALGLVPRLRQALILVDGKRDDDALRKLIPAPADDTLLALVQLGCIEAIAITAERPPAAAAAAPAVPVPAPVAAAVEAAPTLSPGEIRQRAVRWISDHLGPYGDPLNLKLEKAKNEGDLRAALELADSFVRQQLGAARSQEFQRHVGMAAG